MLAVKCIIFINEIQKYVPQQSCKPSPVNASTAEFIGVTSTARKFLR